MLAHRTSGHVELCSDLAGGYLPIADEAKNAATPWLRQCVEAKVEVLLGQGRTSAHAHSPTGLPSGSAIIANDPNPSGKGVGSTSRVPPNFSARSSAAPRSSTLT